MFIIDAVEKQIERLQEISNDRDYEGVFSLEAVEAEINLSKELRELIKLHSELISKEKEYKNFEEELEEEYKYTTNTDKSFGEQLKDYMEEMEIDTKELAKLMKMDESIITFILEKAEPGKMSLVYLYEIAKVLELNMTEIGNLVMSCRA